MVEKYKNNCYYCEKDYTCPDSKKLRQAVENIERRKRILKCWKMNKNLTENPTNPKEPECKECTYYDTELADEPCGNCENYMNFKRKEIQ